MLCYESARKAPEKKDLQPELIILYNYNSQLNCTSYNRKMCQIFCEILIKAIVTFNTVAFKRKENERIA